jgi:hypothetical protein
MLFVLVFFVSLGLHVHADEFRTWTDSTGKHKTEAQFIDLKDGNVRLKMRVSGAVIAVPLEKLSNADQAFVKSRLNEAPPPAEVDAVGAKRREAWSLEDVVVSTTYGGHDISQSYSEPLGGAASFTIKPERMHRLVVLRCRLAAEVPDSDAVARLMKWRQALKAAEVVGPSEIPFSVVNQDKYVTEEDIRKLGGSYRMFNMAEIALIDANGKRHEPLWCVGPHGSYQLIGDTGGLTNAENGSKAPWHKAYATNKTFTGLLEVGNTVELLLMFRIPTSVSLETLDLQIQSQPSIAVQHVQEIPKRKQ